MLRLNRVELQPSAASCGRPRAGGASFRCWMGGHAWRCFVHVLLISRGVAAILLLTCQPWAACYLQRNHCERMIAPCKCPHQHAQGQAQPLTTSWMVEWPMPMERQYSFSCVGLEGGRGRTEGRGRED